MNVMRCDACHYSQFGEFPSFITHCFADTNAHAMKLEKVALELGKTPNCETGNCVIVTYVCPNCGTLRIRLKAKKGEAQC